MRKFIKRITAAVLISLPFIFISEAIAEKPLKIAVLDLNAIRTKSIAIKSIRTQIEKYRKTFQKNIKKEEDALRVANQKLAKRRTLLSPDAFAKERRLFEKNVVVVQKLARQHKLDLERSLNKAMLVVEKKMNSIMADVATKRGTSLVLRRQNTILADRSMDMTEEVLKRLNAELKMVSVKKPGNK